MKEENTRKRFFLMKCRRGMLELDILLNRFLENKFDALNASEQKIFEEFLDQPDPDLYAWLMGYDKPNSEKFVMIVKKIVS